MPRKLTDRQIMILAALERLGEVTLPELHSECPMGTTPSTTLRVVEQLMSRGLVTWRGRWAWVYLGEPPEGAAHDVEDDEVVWFRSLQITHISTSRGVMKP